MVPRVIIFTPKMAPVIVDTDTRRERAIAEMSGMPYDYVPHPDGVVLNTIPFQWPDYEEWSRLPDW